MAQVPGVTMAGAIQHLPLGGSSWNLPVFPEGREIPAGVEPPSAAYRVATPDYFRTMRLHLIEGRGFSADDGPGRPMVTVISDTLARELWPGRDAIGRRLRAVIGGDGWIEVVGVVAGVHASGLDEPPVGEMYRPYAQDPMASMALVIRTAGEPASVAAGVRAVVRRADPNVAVSDVRPLEAVVAASVDRPRATAILLLVFAGLALALGVVGVHGVVAYDVGQRTQRVRRAHGGGRAREHPRAPGGGRRGDAGGERPRPGAGRRGPGSARARQPAVRGPSGQSADVPDRGGGTSARRGWSPRGSPRAAPRAWIPSSR